MNENKSQPTVKLCVVALMAALVFLGSWLRIEIPAIVGVSAFHLGNPFCALSGILLGPGWGGLASGLGSAIYDLTSGRHFTEFPITFVTKGLYGVVAGLVFHKLFRGRSNYVSELIASLCGAVTYIVLYLAQTYFIKGMLLGGLTAEAAWMAVLGKIPASLFNGVVTVVFAPILSVAISRALRTAKLDRLLV